MWALKQHQLKATIVMLDTHRTQRRNNTTQRSQDYTQMVLGPGLPFQRLLKSRGLPDEINIHTCWRLQLLNILTLSDNGHHQSSNILSLKCLTETWVLKWMKAKYFCFSGDVPIKVVSDILLSSLRPFSLLHLYTPFLTIHHLHVPYLFYLCYDFMDAEEMHRPWIEQIIYSRYVLF